MYLNSYAVAEKTQDNMFNHTCLSKNVKKGVAVMQPGVHSLSTRIFVRTFNIVSVTIFTAIIVVVCSSGSSSIFAVYENRYKHDTCPVHTSKHSLLFPM
jgi:hypothetical protein